MAIDQDFDDLNKLKSLQIKVTDDLIETVNNLFLWAKENGFSQKEFDGSVIANMITGAASYCAVNEMKKGDFIDFCSETFDKQWHNYLAKKDKNVKE